MIRQNVVSLDIFFFQFRSSQHQTELSHSSSTLNSEFAGLKTQNTRASEYLSAAVTLLIFIRSKPCVILTREGQKLLSTKLIEDTWICNEVIKYLIAVQLCASVILPMKSNWFLYLSVVYWLFTLSQRTATANLWFILPLFTFFCC